MKPVFEKLLKRLECAEAKGEDTYEISHAELHDLTEEYRKWKETKQ